MDALEEVVYVIQKSKHIVQKQVDIDIDIDIDSCVCHSKK